MKTARNPVDVDPLEDWISDLVRSRAASRQQGRRLVNRSSVAASDDRPADEEATAPAVDPGADDAPPSV